MFVTAVQLIVARTLVQDPERYAELVEGPLSQVSLVRKHQRSKQPARKDLLKQFDSPTKRANESRMPSSAFSSHSSESSSDDEKEIPKRTIKEKRGKSKPKRLQQGLELLAENEEDVATTSKKTPEKEKDKKNK